jgi:alkyl hydroperoxide reductase subunit AhpC
VSLQLGDLAPDFVAESTHGPIKFHEWKGSAWAVLFSHPRDFTPVCTTELGTLARLKPEFERRSTKVLGLSVDPVDTHRQWERDIIDVTGHKLNFPLIGDPDRRIAMLYGMVHPKAADTTTVRSVFILGPDHRIRLMLTYPASTGRNFSELLRAIDSLQLTAEFQVATPADWAYGEDVIIVPALSDEEARKRFPRGWVASKPYLRVTPQPNLAS